MTVEDLTVIFVPGTHVSPHTFSDVPLPTRCEGVPAAWMEDPSPKPCTLVSAAHFVVRQAEGRACVIVGHSTGGAIAATAAFLFPDRVRGLLLLDSGPDMRRHTTIASKLEELTDPVPDDVLTRHALTNVPAGSPQEWIDGMVDYARQVGGATAAEVLADQSATDLRDRGTLPHLPVEVFHGGLDSKRSSDDAAAWRDVFPRVRVLVDESVGHTPQLEAPLTVGAALDRLVERVRIAASRR